MKKKQMYYIIVWIALISLFNVLFFVTPDEINGIKRDMKFPELYEVKRIYDEAITYTNDADKTDMNVNLGPMSFSIIRYYDKLPNSLTFASESADAKCYLVYLD